MNTPAPFHPIHLHASRPIRKHLATLALLPILLHASQASPFLYRTGDLVLLARRPGNATDYVAHLGTVNDLLALEPGRVHPITGVSPAQLTGTFGSLGNVHWSVAAANRPPLLVGFPLQTIWVTAPRLAPQDPATPWLRKGQFVQGNAASQIEGIGVNASLSSSLLPGGPNNTANGVIIPTDAPFAVGPLIGSSGNYVDTFQGSVESITPDAFGPATVHPSRSDFFELQPGTTAQGTLNSPGRWIGTFEFRGDGTFTFIPAQEVQPVPVILEILRAGPDLEVRVATVTGSTYRLRYSSILDSVDFSSWASGPEVTATGDTVILTTSAPDNDPRFFIVERLP